MVLTTTGLPAHQIDVTLYDAIVDAGLLEGQRVELIDGIITDMSPQYEEHAVLVARLTRYLMSSALQVRPQLPLQVAGDSVPEPDLALAVEGPVRDRPSTAELVIEVSLSSDKIDRGRKQELYAAAGVPVYWIVDVAAQTVEVRTDPAANGYRTLQTFGRGQIAPSPADDVAPLAVDELFRGF